MITDRRVRARNWDTADIAATNALFWTSEGWNGSEEMVAVSLRYCMHRPDHPRITLISREIIKTVIVALQGVQAIVVFGGPLVDYKLNS